MFGRYTFINAGLAFVFIFVVQSNASWGSVSLPEPRSDIKADPKLTIILIDGLHRQTFFEELEAGNLPLFSQIIRGGTLVESGIAAFPSMTGYGYFPLMTGKKSVKSGLAGMRWFDRDNYGESYRNYMGRTVGAANEDLTDDTKTIFEHFSDEYSISVNNFINRGSHQNEFTSWEVATSKYRSRFWLMKVIGAIPILGDFLVRSLDDLTNRTIELAINSLENDPKVQWITFNATDSSLHDRGITDEYREALRLIDDRLTDFMYEAAQRDDWNQRVFAFITDHGGEDVAHNLNLEEIFEEQTPFRLTRHISTNIIRGSLESDLSYLRDYDFLQAVNGNNISYLYVRNPMYDKDDSRAWTEAPPTKGLLRYRNPSNPFKPINLPEMIANLEGIEFAIIRVDEGHYRIFSRHGVSEIRKSNGTYIYSLVSGNDPLGYETLTTNDASIYNQALSEMDWLSLTANSKYPHSVPRIADFLESEDSGDIVITSLETYDLADDFEPFIRGNHGGHGGLRENQMKVPYILFGNGIKAGQTIPTSRAEDIGATLLHIMGVETESSSQDGRVLTEALDE